MTSSNHESSRAAFVIVNGADIYALNKDVLNIGRMEDNDIVLQSTHVSRYHAQIRKLEDHDLLVDLSSTSGTSVNGEKVTEKRLSPGDVISLAGVPIIYGQTSGPDKLDDTLEKEAQKYSSKHTIEATDSVDVDSIDRFLDLFDPPEDENLEFLDK